MCRIPAVTNFTAIHVYTLGTEEMCCHDKVHIKLFLSPLHATGRCFLFWSEIFKTSNKEGFGLKDCYVFS